MSVVLPILKTQTLTTTGVSTSIKQETRYKGSLKFNSYARSFEFVKDNSWVAETITTDQAIVVVRNGTTYSAVHYKNRIRFLELISTQTDTLYSFCRKRDRFYIDTYEKNTSPLQQKGNKCE